VEQRKIKRNLPVFLFTLLIILFSSIFALFPTLKKTPEKLTVQEVLGKFSYEEIKKVKFQVDESTIVFDPWLNGFPYRRAITINNNASINVYELPINISNSQTSELTDYQVLITITNTTILSHMVSDGRDIRFFNQSVPNPYQNTTGKLSYWIENISSSQLKVWVKVSRILASTNTTIYMYYGNSSASSESNADNTFIFFDDFETNRGWTYSENGADWSGAYTTAQYVSPTTSYVISYPWNTGSAAGYYGRITKNITAPGTQVMTEVKVKDDYTGSTSGYHFKQVYLAGTLLYEDDVAGDEGGWVSVAATTTPAAGTQSLYLQIYDKAGVSNFGINAWWSEELVEVDGEYLCPECREIKGG
jgi:hypothetical protein